MKTATFQIASLLSTVCDDGSVQQCFSAADPSQLFCVSGAEDICFSLEVNSAGSIMVTSYENRAHEYFEMYALPSVGEWRKNPDDMRLAMQAAVALNQMADYFFHAFAKAEPSRVFDTSKISDFRRKLVERCPSFALIRDVAEAHKHVKLNRKDRYVTSAGQTMVLKVGYGEAEYGVGKHVGKPEVVITLDDGTKRHFSQAFEETVQMWESML